MARKIIRVLMVAELDVEDVAGRFAEMGIEAPYCAETGEVDMDDLDVDAFVQASLDDFRESVQPGLEFGISLWRVDGVDKLTQGLRASGTEIALKQETGR